MQGVRPIGANNKIFLSEQAPTEYFIIHSCMSHSNSKIVAISTVKPVSQNYASATGSARVVKSIYFWLGTKYFKRNTADFHKDGYFLQNAGVTKDLRIAFVVCDVNSEQKRLQVKIFVFEKLEGNLTIWRLNWLYAIDQKQKKNGNNAQIQFSDRQNNFLLPL